MNAAEIIHRALTEKYGRHQGLNADWATCVWPIGDGLWLVDEEDGTYCICRQVVDEDDNLVAEVVDRS